MQRQDLIVTAINGWIGHLFDPAQHKHTVRALLGAQPAAQAIGTDDAKARRADADQRPRRYQAAIAAGADPEPMIEAINQAQAERRAAQVEIDNAPVPDVLTAADVNAMIDSPGDVGAALDEGRPAALTRLYQALELGVRCESGARAAYVTARPRVDSAGVRGGLAHSPPKDLLVGHEFVRGRVAVVRCWLGDVEPITHTCRSGLSSLPNLRVGGRGRVESASALM